MTTTASLHGRLEFVRNGVHALATPLHSIRAQTAAAIGNAWHRYVALIHVSEENVALKRELEHLRAEQVRLTEENLRLKRMAQLGEVARTTEHHSLPAEVIAGDASTWSRTFLLRGGAEDGVRPNDVAVSSAGLVGRIMEVTPHTSRVLLITDARSAVDCLVQRSRAAGIVVGATENTCRMKYVAASHDLTVGDRVVSSGLGGVFPKGLLLGTVISVSKDTTEPFQRVMVLPAADLNRLEEVLILSQP